MGFVGAGGLGQLMDQAMKMLNGGEACSILLVFVVLVLLADALSGWLRRSLDVPPAARTSAFGVRSVVVLLAVAAGVVASWRLLYMDLGALFTADAASSMGDFVSGFPARHQPCMVVAGAGRYLGDAGHLGGRHFAGGCRWLAAGAA